MTTILCTPRGARHGAEDHLSKPLRLAALLAITGRAPRNKVEDQVMYGAAPGGWPGERPWSPRPGSCPGASPPVVAARLGAAGRRPGRWSDADEGYGP